MGQLSTARSARPLQCIAPQLVVGRLGLVELVVELPPRLAARQPIAGRMDVVTSVLQTVHVAGASARHAKQYCSCILQMHRNQGHPRVHPHPAGTDCSLGTNCLRPQSILSVREAASGYRTAMHARQYQVWRYPENFLVISPAQQQGFMGFAPLQRPPNEANLSPSPGMASQDEAPHLHGSCTSSASSRSSQSSTALHILETGYPTFFLNCTLSLPRISHIAPANYARTLLHLRWGAQSTAILVLRFSTLGSREN